MGVNIIKKKLGRPLIGELKNINLKIRIGESLNQQLERYCKQSNQSKAESVREALQSFLKYN